METTETTVMHEALAGIDTVRATVLAYLDGESSLSELGIRELVKAQLLALAREL